MNDVDNVFVWRYAMTAEQKAAAIECACKRFQITEHTEVSILPLLLSGRESDLENDGVALRAVTVPIYTDGDYCFAYFGGLDKLYIGLTNE